MLLLLSVLVAALQADPGDVELRASYRRALQIAQETWDVEGTVRRGRDADGAELLRVDGRLEVRGVDGAHRTLEATLWRAGERWTYLDRAAGVVHEGAGPGVGGRASAALFGLWSAAVEPAEGLASEGTTTYGPRSVRVLARDDAGLRVRRYVDPEDGWPWYVERQAAADGAERSFETWKRLALDVSPSLGPEVFAVEDLADAQRRPPLAVTAAEAFELAPDDRAAEVGVLAGLDDFRARFEAARGKVRLVGLFGPT